MDRQDSAGAQPPAPAAKPLSARASARRRRGGLGAGLKAWPQTPAGAKPEESSARSVSPLDAGRRRQAGRPTENADVTLEGLRRAQEKIKEADAARQVQDQQAGLSDPAPPPAPMAKTGTEAFAGKVTSRGSEAGTTAVAPPEDEGGAAPGGGDGAVKVSPPQGANTPLPTAGTAVLPERKSGAARREAKADSPVKTGAARLSPAEPGRQPTPMRGAAARDPFPRTAKPSAPTEAAEAKPSVRKSSRKPAGRSGREKVRGGRVTSREIFNSVDSEARQASLAKYRRRKDRERARQRGAGEVQRVRVRRDVQVPDVITVQELALRMAEPGSEVVRKLFSLGHMTTINGDLDGDTAELIVREFGHRPQRVSASDVEIGLEGKADAPESLRPRAPVVTVMGHVDHGKTSLLDAIRQSDIAAGEAGAITQHIGASHVETPHGRITFLDTPGHAAFSSMRARGASVTDLVVLAVAANDGLMPQTEEAIDHARAASVPIVVAINKIDLDDSDPERVRTDLLRKDVVVEGRGGETLDVEVSAKTGKGVNELLETISLQASLMDLKANPDRLAEGAVVEARLDKGRGSVATVLVQRGTLRKSDIFVIGSHWGRARTIRDERGNLLETAGPAIPVEIDGLSGTPEAGDRFIAVESEARAREIAAYRSDSAHHRRIAPPIQRGPDLFGKVDRQEFLPVVVKADVHGSSEAIVEALAKIGNDDVKVHVVHAGVGAISESDVTLASTSGARVVGFNVRPNVQAKLAAAKFGVSLSFHSVIYELLDEVRSLASGLLAPDIRETEIARAEVLEVFRVSKIGAVAGCRVVSGTAQRNTRARLVRNGTVVYTGNLATLKRFKHDAVEVHVGNECGMSFRSHQDIREGDVVELYQVEEISRSL